MRTLHGSTPSPPARRWWCPVSPSSQLTEPPRAWHCCDRALCPAVPARGSLQMRKLRISPVLAVAGNQAEGSERGGRPAPRLPLFSGGWLLGRWVGPAC